jgi:hypothetical protein
VRASMKRDCWQVGPILRSLGQLGHKADLEQRVVIGPLDTDGVEITTTGPSQPLSWKRALEIASNRPLPAAPRRLAI